MAYEFPRPVYRVVYGKDGMPYVTERMMISRSGSWFTTQRKDGSTVKENGNHWSNTASEAIQKEARFIMFRYSCPNSFSQQEQLRSLEALITEAMEWGRLLGNIESELECSRKRTDGRSREEAAEARHGS